MANFFDLTDASIKNASRARDKRAAKAKTDRAKKAKDTADNPVPPAKNPVISRQRALVSNEQRRKSHAKASASKATFKARGSRSLQPSKTKTKTFKCKKMSRVSVFDRIKQNPDQSLFRDTKGQMACEACNNKIIQHIKKSGVQSHCRSEAHLRNMKKSSTSQDEDKVKVMFVLLFCGCVLCAFCNNYIYVGCFFFSYLQLQQLHIDTYVGVLRIIYFGEEGIFFCTFALLLC